MVELELEQNIELKKKDIDGVLGQVNLKRLKTNENTAINHDRIKKLKNIRESIAMLDKEEEYYG